MAESFANNNTNILNFYLLIQFELRTHNKMQHGKHKNLKPFIMYVLIKIRETVTGRIHKPGYIYYKHRYE